MTRALRTSLTVPSPPTTTTLGGGGGGGGEGRSKEERRQGRWGEERKRRGKERRGEKKERLIFRGARMRDMSIKLVLISQLNSAHIHKQPSLPYQCNPAHIMQHLPIILRQIKVLQYLSGVQLPLCDCRGGQGIPTSCRLNFSSGHMRVTTFWVKGRGCICTYSYRYYNLK